jgi:predicted Zn-dependent protease
MKSINSFRKITNRYTYNRSLLKRFIAHWQESMTVTRLRQASAIVLLSLITLYCSTVPLTGRKQITLIPESQMVTTAAQQYGDFMKEHRVIREGDQARTVASVGTSLKKALSDYYTKNNLPDATSGYSWEFNVVESAEVNAWAMPGGKVVMYTGILPLCNTEAAIAAVMGHEIAHVAARHGNERMSQALLVQMGGMALSAALKNKPEQTRKLWLAAFGMGAQVGILLPYSRLHEKEADRLGMILMAMAGYDPNNAVEFWQRMSEMNKAAKPPEFLSTHPSDATRIKLLKELLPEALQYYRR